MEVTWKVKIPIFQKIHSEKIERRMDRREWDNIRIEKINA